MAAVEVFNREIDGTKYTVERVAGGTKDSSRHNAYTRGAGGAYYGLLDGGNFSGTKDECISEVHAEAQRRKDKKNPKPKQESNSSSKNEDKSDGNSFFDSKNSKSEDDSPGKFGENASQPMRWLYLVVIVALLIFGLGIDSVEGILVIEVIALLVMFPKIQPVGETEEESASRFYLRIVTIGTIVFFSYIIFPILLNIIGNTWIPAIITMALLIGLFITIDHKIIVKTRGFIKTTIFFVGIIILISLINDIRHII